ncbi:MAG TPA: CopG family transcriptional regulator [Cyanobacteria bacterium UBA11372]|nr:CopG family transcriptional regulator [Cyanobacteria bacterium UBA11372]
MEKQIFFRLSEEEYQKLEAYCKKYRRTKSDVLRELIRNLETYKPS